MVETVSGIVGIVCFMTFTNCLISNPSSRNSSLVRAARRRHLRLEDRPLHRAVHHRAAGAGRHRRRRLVLADGLPPAAEDQRPAAASARVPQSAVRKSGRGVGADARLSVIGGSPEMREESN